MKRDDILFAALTVAAVGACAVSVYKIVAKRASVSTAMALHLPSGVTRQELIGLKPHLTGSLQASQTLIEFGDYGCPPCRSAYEQVRKLLPQCKGHWNFVFRNYPLTTIHPYAYDAAVLAESAGQQGKFWEMHDLLYDRSDALEPSELSKYAQTLHLDARQLAAAKSGSAKEQVDLDMASANHLGLFGTPSFILIDKDGKANPLTTSQLAQVLQ